MTHPAILASIEAGGETITLRRARDWQEIRDASSGGHIDRKRDVTTYTGEHDGDPWSVAIVAEDE